MDIWLPPPPLFVSTWLLNDPYAIQNQIVKHEVGVLRLLKMLEKMFKKGKMVRGRGVFLFCPKLVSYYILSVQ